MVMVRDKFVFFTIILFLVLISLNFVSAFTIYSVTPANYINRTINTLINITINNTDTTNITQLIIQLPQDATFYVTSNGTDAAGVAFSNTSVDGTQILIWNGTAGDAIMTNITSRYFLFNVSLPTSGTNTFTITANHTANNANTTSYSFTVNFAFAGYIKNETGGNASNVNVSFYQFTMVPSGPPTETLIAVTNTSADGSFNFASLNGSASMYKIKIVQYNASGSARKTGSTLPPFPANMFYPMTLPEGGFAFEFMRPPSLNSTTFYTQPAATLSLSAHNSSSQQKFGYMVMDQVTGFPVESNIMNTVSSINITIPIDRNYTVMFVRAPFGANAFGFNDTYCDGAAMNDSLCPTPPISNSTLGALTEGQVLSVNQSLIVNERRLTGCLSIQAGQNNSALNITKIIPKMIPWPGFVPPVKSDRGDINITTDLNYTIGGGQGGCSFAFYNISVLGSASGISYLIEFYAKNGSSDAVNPGNAWNLAAFQNITITNNTNFNITLYRLVGNYTVEGEVNTSKLGVFIKNSTGGIFTTNTNMNVDVKIKNPATGTLHYLIDTNGTFYMPILNNSNWAKMNIFSSDSPPKEITLNLSNATNSITLTTMSEGKGTGMKKFNSTGGVDMINSSELNGTMAIQMRFLRNSEACNVVNPPSSCEITSMSAKDFNPFKALVAGKINMEMKLTATNVTLTFMNFDMFSAKQPPMESVMNNNASAASSTSQLWQFGSLAPTNTYESAIIGMSYSDNSSATGTYFNDSMETLSISIPFLYDENWNLAWNVSRGDTSANLSDDFIDYNSSALYRDYLTSGGVSISKTDPNLNVTPAYINTSSNTVYMKVPHFSGLGPSSSGVSTVTAAAAAAAAAGGGAAGTVAWTMSYNPTTAELAAGYSKELAAKHRIKFKINNTEHYVGIVSLTETTATVNVSSAPQQTTLNIGDEKKFELTNDTFYDISVKLDGIANNKANVTVKSIHEEIVVGPAEEVTKEEEIGVPEGVKPSIFKKTWFFWVIIVAVIIIIAIIIYQLYQKKRYSKRGY